MMPGINFSGLGTGIALVLMAIASVILTSTILIALPRGIAGWKPACAIGWLTFLFFASFLVVRLATRDILPFILVAIFFLPACLGLLTVAVSLLAARRAGVRLAAIAVSGVLLLGALVTLVHIALVWRAMSLRGALWDAVLAEDVRTVQRLLAAGAAGDDADDTFRQRLFVHAAGDANVELVVAFLDAGSDPNDAGMSLLPLVAAVGADSTLRLHPIDPETHTRNRLRVVTLLLDRGANPSPELGEGQATPAEVAWTNGSDDLLRVLEARGAKDAREVVARFENLLAAAASGDAARVEEIVAPYGARLQRDTKNRSPLVIAAENGHLAVVNALLEAYGGFVKCDLVNRALAAARRNDHADVANRLLDVCR